MRLRLLALTAVVTISSLVSACTASLQQAPVEPGATTSAGATGSRSARPSSEGPVITAFQIIDDVSCSGSQASVPMSWSTRDAQTSRLRETPDAVYPSFVITLRALLCSQPNGIGAR